MREPARRSRRLRHMRISRLSLPLLLALAAAAGAVAAPAPAAPLVTYRMGGGLLRCEPTTCVVAITIDRHGTVRSLRKDGSVLRQVRLGAPAGNRLARLDATTPLARLHPRPFTGVCPITYDGLEITYEVRKGPRVFRYDSCKVVIPKLALFREIDRMVARAGKGDARSR